MSAAAWPHFSRGHGRHPGSAAPGSVPYPSATSRAPPELPTGRPHLVRRRGKLGLQPIPGGHAPASAGAAGRLLSNGGPARFPIGRRPAIECCRETAPASEAPRSPAPSGHLEALRAEEGGEARQVSASAWRPASSVLAREVARLPVAGKRIKESGKVGQDKIYSVFKLGRSTKQQKMYNFEDELTCPICYSIFEDPRVLPCSHTFCRNCLENVLQASGNFYIWRPLRIPLKCPNCRSIIEIASTGIESLPVNFALRAIIEKYQQEDHPDIVTCPEHYRQPLNVYCLLDKKLVCGHCLTIGQHHGHPIDDLQSAYLKEKDTPQKLLEQLTDTHWTDLTCLIEKLEEEKSHSEKMVQGDKEVVLQYFKELSDILEQKKKNFLTALSDVGSLINQEYIPQIEGIREMRKQQLELMTLTTSLQEESPLKFLEKVDDVRQRVQILKQSPLPEVQRIEIYPRVSQVLKEDWSITEIGQIKKLLIPEMKISSTRMPCSWPADEKEVEFFKILNIVIVTLISVILMLILFFNQHIITFLNEITSMCFFEVSLSVYQSLSNNLHSLKKMLYHTLYLLKEFMWKIVFR